MAKVYKIKRKRVTGRPPKGGGGGGINDPYTIHISGTTVSGLCPSGSGSGSGRKATAQRGGGGGRSK